MPKQYIGHCIMTTYTASIRGSNNMYLGSPGIYAMTGGTRFTVEFNNIIGGASNTSLRYCGSSDRIKRGSDYLQESGGFRVILQLPDG